MLKKIFITVALLVAVVIGVSFVVIAMQPDTFAIERTETIAAPPAAVFAEINDLQKWDAWSPWKELDPKAKMTFSNPTSGKGAKFTWSGNDNIGEGSLTILESRPNELVELEQAFVRPMEGKTRMEFSLKDHADGTQVRWLMDGTNDFFGKAMCLVMDMDACVGTEMAKGLGKLKKLVEEKRVPKSP